MARARVAPIVMTAIAVLAAASPTPAAPPLERPPGDPASLGTPAEFLARVALPADTTACRLAVALPGSDEIAGDCMPTGMGGGGDTPGAGASGDPRSFDLVESARIDTPRWHASLSPLAGSSHGAFARVHGYGDVATMGAAGTTLWTRPAMSFFDDWGVAPFIVPFIPLGASPLNPFVIASERPYATGDLTGDGVDDVAVGHYVIRLNEDETAQVASSFVTLLDGTSGETRWWREYPGFVTQVLASSETLVVGVETGDVGSRPPGTPVQGLDGTTTALHAVSFSGGRATDAWSVDTGSQWARWLAAEPLGGDRLAASWLTRSGTGQTIAVDVTTGEVAWRHDHAGYPRAIRYDASREVAVVVDQADPSSGYRYDLVGLRAADGSVATRITRPAAVPVSLAVGDLTGSDADEWAVGEVLSSDGANQPVPRADELNGVGISVLDPDAGAALWDRQTRCPGGVNDVRVCGGTDLPITYGLMASEADRVLVAASFVGADTQLAALDGDGGGARWSRRGDAAYPLFLAPHRVGSRRTVLAATSSFVVRAYDVETGETELSIPLLYEPHAADVFDVNGDGTRDVIVGGESGAVFALDGRTLGANPRALWVREVGGPVHQVEVVDLDGDGDREVVAAATSRLAVLSASDGRPVPGHGAAYGDAADYVWSFTVGDVNRDGRLDVVVPTRTLAAYSGLDGSRLWEFSATKPHVMAHFSTAVVTPEGLVASQFSTQSGVPFLNARSHQAVVAIDGRTGNVAWGNAIPSKFGIALFWRSAAIDPAHPCGEGTAVAFTWDDPSEPIVGWHPRTDVYDSRSGLLCHTHGPLVEGAVDMGTTFVPGLGLLELNWFNVAHLEPGDVKEIQFAEENAATSDVALADFGSLGEAFLKTWTDVKAYGPTTPTGSEGDNPPILAQWKGQAGGELLVTNLDADAADEVISMGFDWPAYSVVASFSSIGVFHSDYLPHGLTVLEAR